MSLLDRKGEWLTVLKSEAVITFKDGTTQIIHDWYDLWSTKEFAGAFANITINIPNNRSK